METDVIQKEELNTQQNLIKLIINSIYGILGSRFYSVGNVILANVITARARRDIFLISKALNGCQVITDGVTYQPNNVTFLKYDRKLGLKNLSNFVDDF